MARGLKNNNPGNIRISTARYLGEVPKSTDKAFKQFESMVWGYRAMFVLLYTYQTKYGLKTIRQMIEIYAPPTENNTAGYIGSVAKWSGVDADSTITATNRDVMVPIVAAISRVENGVPAVMADIEAGWELFLKHKP